MEAEIYTSRNVKSMGLKVVQRQQLEKALNLLLAPDYVNLAFNLPPGSSTIWSFMEEDIICHSDAEHPSSDIDNLVQFLLLFFSAQLVDNVRKNLECLAHSFLGIQYALRLAKGSIASTILDDMLSDYVYRQEGSLAGFNGDSTDLDTIMNDSGKDKRGVECIVDEGWREVKSTRIQRSLKQRKVNLGRGRGKFGGGGRIGGMVSGIRGHYEKVSQEHFVNLKIVEVLLPAYNIPPKENVITEANQVRAGKSQQDHTIAERSCIFHTHSHVNEGPPYDPTSDEHGKIHLYHGTRQSLLNGPRGFRAKGIKPRDKANEFCADKAFYVSNSVRHAYEHSLHHHPSQNSNDLVAVFVFDVDIEILHGHKPPHGSDGHFNVIWFERPESEWEEFCRGNLNRMLAREDADVVIGPICKVMPTPQKYEALEIELEGGVQLNQIAFCSKRSWDWLEKCTIMMYFEKSCRDIGSRS